MPGFDAEHGGVASCRLSDDLNIAIRKVSGGWAACLVRDGVVIDARVGNRLAPVLAILRRQRERTGDGILTPGPVEGGPFAFADRVLGLAAFRLAYLCGAREMWGETASALAVREGERRGVRVTYHRLVPSIMNAKMDDLCPMEKLSLKVSSDWEFYWTLPAGGKPACGDSSVGESNG